MFYIFVEEISTMHSVKFTSWKKNWKTPRLQKENTSQVLTAIGLVNEGAIFLTPPQNQLPVTKKFITGDYVNDFYCCAKFGGICPWSLLGK